MDSAVTVIQEVGFPIAAALGLGWFIYKLIMRIVDGMETKLDTVDEKVESQIAAIEERLGTKLDSQHGILVALIDRVRSLDNEIIRQLEKEQLEKDKVLWSIMLIGIILIIGIFVQNIKADQIVHKFKSPSFSGINTSSHYLTIENQQYTRKMTIKEELKALQEQIERDKENTTLARFLKNLESRIYAQLSRQLVDNLFGETPQTSGTIELEGNTIEYTSDGQFITLKITDADGYVTEITLPIGSFTF